MSKSYPNAPKLVSQFLDGSLAHDLASCFLGQVEAGEAAAKVRAVLEARRQKSSSVNTEASNGGRTS
jgi:hypothetical protein